MATSPSSPRAAVRSNARFRLGKRGAFGVGLAIGSAAVLAMAALATEAGVWLTQRRSAQSAADAAAFAGAIVLQQRGTSEVSTVANQVVNRNGFAANSATTVTVELGLWNSTARTFSTNLSGATPDAVRVQVSQRQFMGLARLIGNTAPTAWGGAVAAIRVAGDACILSKVDITRIGGTQNTFAPGCVIASNNSTDKSVWMYGNADVTADGVVTLGNCSGCTKTDVHINFARPGVRTTDPYEDVNTFVDQRLGTTPNLSGRCTSPEYLDASGRNAARNNYVSATVVAARNASLPAAATVNVICDNLTVGNGQTLTFTPGVYVFYGYGNGQNQQGNLILSNGGTVACNGCSPGGAGVTLIFTGSAGSTVGTFRMTGGTFNLNAPYGDAANPSPLDGILIYRDDLNTQSGGNTDVELTGNGASSIYGAIYAPTSQVQMVGTSNLNVSAVTVNGQQVGCSPVIGRGITLNGTSGVDIRGCNRVGTETSKVLIVELVQ